MTAAAMAFWHIAWLSLYRWGGGDMCAWRDHERLEDDNHVDDDSATTT